MELVAPGSAVVDEGGLPRLGGCGAVLGMSRYGKACSDMTS